MTPEEVQELVRSMTVKQLPVETWPEIPDACCLRCLRMLWDCWMAGECAYCETCRRRVGVVDAGSSAGFGAGNVHWADLDCGHQIVDDRDYAER